MAHLILAETTASVSELKRDPMGTVAAGEGAPVAVVAVGKRERNAVYRRASDR